MKLNININEENLSIQTEPEVSLLELLRNQKLLSVKCGCKNHNCGSCAVLLDDTPVLACKIPCGILRNAKIVTLEHFSKTAVYQEIVKGSGTQFDPEVVEAFKKSYDQISEIREKYKD